MSPPLVLLLLLVSAEKPLRTVLERGGVEESVKLEHPLTVGTNKTIPRDMERPTLLALAHFPELRDTRIEFKKSKIEQSLAARPKLSSLFRRRRARRYTVLINTRASFPGILFENLPESAQVGVLAHELAHIVDYRHKPWWRLVWQGSRYLLSARYRRRVEREADRQTVARGLGRQLHCYSSRVVESPTVQHRYRARRLALYLSPQEIASLHDEAGSSAETLTGSVGSDGGCEEND